jgi:hypothetical protein
MNTFVVAGASAVLLTGTVLANAHTQGTEGAREETIKKFEHADTAQGVSISPCPSTATGISEAQTHELVTALGNHWPSFTREAKFLLRSRPNA